MLAVSLWASILLVSFFAGPLAPQVLKRLAGWLLLALVAAAVVCALWFVWLQMAVLHHYCTYCLAVHACALVGGVLALLAVRPSLPGGISSAVVGLLLGGLMPLGQMLFPPAPLYRIDRIADEKNIEVYTFDGYHLPGEAAASEEPIYRELFAGEVRFNMHNLPRLGAADADHVLFKIFDYTCPHCRELHHHVLAAQNYLNRDGESHVAIVMLPAPLDEECNELIPPENSTAGACGLARLALIVWKLAPQRFAEFDAWLFEPKEPRTYAAARAKAAELLGEEKLAAIERHPALDEQLKLNIELFASSPAELMPQLLGRNVVLSQQVESAEELLELLDREFGIN
jgi:protein-disulfide isomerase